MGDFDINSAREAGFSDEQIARELATQKGYDLDAAIEAGHSFTDIANELAGGSKEAAQKGDYEGSPAEAAITGAGVGGAGGLGTFGVQKVLGITPQRAAEVPVAPVEPAPVVAPAVVEEAPLTGREKWNKSLTGVSTPGSQMDKASLARNRGIQEALTEGPMTGGTVSKGGVMLPPQEVARIEAQNKARAAAATAAEEAKLGNRLKRVGETAKKVTKPIGSTLEFISKVPGVGPALAGAGSLGEFQDAYNRASHGDYGRALISTLGGLGSLASLAPTPMTKGIGGGAAIAAPLINELIDRVYGREGYAQGGRITPGLSITSHGIVPGFNLAMANGGMVPQTGLGGLAPAQPQRLQRRAQARRNQIAAQGLAPLAKIIG